jgi:hypothetical protein
MKTYYEVKIERHSEKQIMFDTHYCINLEIAEKWQEKLNRECVNHYIIEEIECTNERYEDLLHIGFMHKEFVF